MSPHMASSDATGTLDFATPLLCQQLWGGDHQAFPVAAPSLTSHGPTQEACLSEQRLFLEEYLSRAEPDVLSHFALPDKVRIEMIEVLAPRADLPKRLFKPNTLELATIVVPLAQETWAFVPALDHTVSVGRTRTSSIAGRGAPAGTPVPWFSSSRLLPSKSNHFNHAFNFGTRARPPARRLAGPESGREASRTGREVLLSVSTPMHDREESKHGPPLIGRDTELALLAELLGGEKRQGVLLVGRSSWARPSCSSRGCGPSARRGRSTGACMRRAARS